MKCFMLAICLFLLSAGISWAQLPKEDGNAWEVTICPVRLLNGQADFTGIIDYIVKTNDNGQVIDVREGRKTEMGRFVDLNEFIPCIKNWRLSASEDHNVTFGIGTIHFDRNPNYINVTGKTKRLKIILPIEIFELGEKKYR